MIITNNSSKKHEAVTGLEFTIVCEFESCDSLSDSFNHPDEYNPALKNQKKVIKYFEN